MFASSDHHKFLEAFACAHVNDGFMEDDGDRMLGCFMKSQGSPLFEVKELKNKGNCFFRQNYFDRAATCYDEACKLLSLSLGIIGGEDILSLSDLAVSLNSNLAACALKLQEYEAAFDLCSMILDAFPRNVKALFRRAVAFMKLKRFVEAERDLVEALVAEPRNKDVLRELEVVKGQLLIKENGKRILEVAPVIGVDGNSKKLVHISAECDTSIKDSENVLLEVMKNQSEADIKVNRSVNMEVTEAQCECDLGFDLSTTVEKNGKVSNESVLEFSRKGGGNSRLRIPTQAYQKLLVGKQVNFYHKRDLSSISIRILNVEAIKNERGCEKKKKKKKRRKCPKKRRHNKMVGINEDVTPPDIVNVKPIIPSVCSSESASCGESSSASSICDNFTPLGTQIFHDKTRVVGHDSSSLVSLEKDQATSTCSLSHNDTNDHQHFIFSASPKKCETSSFDKPFFAPTTSMLCRYPSTHQVHEKGRNIHQVHKKRRHTNSKKNHSQGDESPGHNLSTFFTSRFVSRKSLRPRGVSVSCCRYSPEAQLVKKRKEVFVELANSDRPLKKHILFANPMFSLMSYSNNVIIKSDSPRVG